MLFAYCDAFIKKVLYDALAFCALLHCGCRRLTPKLIGRVCLWRGVHISLR
ncbi:hypothetical protein HMPREF1991_02826 [Hoylesella loescheii DSM 19665 = JCM 12249 = ATCC 15930]|uniref:Uncharacterized protein n=1 Tax=Hoylesella loescheii DSM 19665 = JCM 12249 = ATCC 15930 TaxID=1122985 RepID=A0A069QGH9_HOYLO|nr:hypothetical protein HMPREF1991_02826 [Hoylesella loescheii DSM 19665 = JCM 12249 = ATCC 15930]